MMKLEKGSEQWFKEVFDANYEYIRNYLYYLSGDSGLSEDLTQDVFLQLWDKREKVKDETVRALLFAIARNAFLKSYRRKKYDLKFKSTWFDTAESQSPDHILEMKELDEKLQKTISGLPEKCRVVYLMNRIDNLTYGQIAENLQVSVKSVEKQMSKALSVLRTELEVKK